MKIILLCQSLVVGGTQRQIAILAPALKRRGHDVSVAAFYRGGPFDASLAASGVVIHDLKKSGRWDVVGFFQRLRDLVKHERPDVLYAFLPAANAVAAVVKLLARPAPRVVFGVRSSHMRREHYDWLAGRQYKIEALLSRAADLVIANSRDGLKDMTGRRFRAKRAEVIPNGIDIELFAPDPDGRARLRAEWGVGENDFLVGQVARFDPMKGHHFFFAAIQLLRDRSWRFVCIGIDDNQVSQVRALAKRFGVEGRVVIAGTRTNMSACFSALDIACQASSFGEGFPNAVAEAMASGVPCVVTDIGDSSAIASPYGVVVPPGDAVALADGLAELRKRIEAGAVSAVELRRSIADRFSAARVAMATDQALQSLFV